MTHKRIYGILVLLLMCGMATAQVVVKGNVYGGGEIGKVTVNANVTNTGNTNVTINGGTVNHTVFGGGMGDTLDVMAGLVEGNTLVDMRGGQVRHSVYGGGELGSVGTFTADSTVTYTSADANGNQSVTIPKACTSGTGLAKVLISGGQIGIDSALMPHELTPGLDDYGYVFAGGMGLADSINNHLANGFAVTDSTYLEISGGLITASAYGGSENGLVLGNTRVRMTGGQIGIGHYIDGSDHYWDGIYTDAQWNEAIDAVQNGTLTATISDYFHNCDHWPYDKHDYTIYDIFADDYDSQGGSIEASNGHSFFGNLFGGGSGYYPIAPGVWRRSAGQVNGNATVEIEGGHILTCIYGGNEYTDVKGKATVKMSGGTLGMPDLVQQIVDNPVVDMLFGGGMGDPRPMFSTWANVGEVEVEVTGGTIFGSIYGGGEDGHVLGDVMVTVNMTYDSVRIGTWGTSSLDGNIFGAGRGFSGWTATAGDVKGNTTINFQQGTLLGSIYGGGRLGSVDGTATVNISGGTIGNGTESTLTHTIGGNVFGGAQGRLHVLDSTVNVIWPSLAHVQQTKVHLTGGTVRGNVYGGGELGTVLDSAIVVVDGGTVNRDVYGGGYGSGSITMVGNYTPAGSSTTVQVTPMQMAGRVMGNTLVQLNGGWIRKNVYGGGEMASVGTVQDSTKHDEGSHALALSWPYAFTYANDANGNPTGITNIQVTGGRLGITGKDQMGNGMKEDNGDIYGGGKGLVGPNRYTMAHCANVNRTVITIAYNDTVSTTPENYKDNQKLFCITGAVYGGGENGYVNDSTSITLTNGLIGHAMYGGGKGKDTYGADLYSHIAGKVYGNTHIHINGGYVVRNVFGGGNLASVGKGNYASISGGTNFGETDLQSADWTAVRGSGHTYVDIKGGQLGMLKPGKPDDVFKDNVPYGSVFGGCRGMVMSADYGPTGDLFGFVNFTHVTIGTEGGANTAPKIFGSVYGGAQDGHVRWSTNTVVNSGEIGVDYNSTTATATMGTDQITSKHWVARGNVFGGGSGIGTYDVIAFNTTTNQNDTTPTYNPNAGSVLQSTNLTVNGGIIHRNVYGGGDLASVSVPVNNAPADSTSRTNVNIYGSIGQNTTANVYGGNVFGASRGRSQTNIDLNDFAHCVATEVNIGTTSGSDSPVVPCSVYGGGELGMVDTITHVTLNRGVVGTLGYTWKQATTNHSTSPLDSLFLSYGGNLYGGGQGLDTVRDAALVLGNTNVEIKGGQVLKNVYGGGELASVGRHNDSYQPVANTGLASVTIEGGQVGVGPVYLNKQGSPTTTTDSICIPIGLNGFNGYVFGGGQGVGDDPITGVNPYGKYYQFADVNATLVTVNITSTDSIHNRIWGNVLGGADDGHVLDSTKVLYVSGLTGTMGTTGYDGNIYGGGRNYQKKNYTAGRVGGNTKIQMTGGQIYGNIYGGGSFAMTGINEVAYMDETDANSGNTQVLVQGGIVGNNTPTNNPDIPGEIFIETFSNYSMGNVYGGGKGDVEGINIEGHPAASALLIGATKNSNVVISEEDPGTPTHIYGIVFGGGEVANVGKYSYTQSGLSITNIDTVAGTGWARVTINGGTIGGDRARMRYDMASDDPDDGDYWTKYNDDLGYVYGGGEGIVDNPKNFDVVNSALDGDIRLINLMATVNHTEVEINGGWIKASVFGGAEAGHVRGNTLVTINGGQIGAGDNTVDDRDELYAEDQFVSPLKEGGITVSDALYRTAHWIFGDTVVTNPGTDEADTSFVYRPFDLVLLKNDTVPSDGKSWFGNVFGGGSGWFPYVDSIPGTNTARCSWNPLSGKVWGNTHVVITGGHILNNVYGANESTDVGGHATIEMRGGTVGVPQTTAQIKENPSFGLIFGGGSGDPRPVFDTITNVDSTNVIITGGIVYGSVYGGAEDGHVLGNTRVTVNEDSGHSTIIGCTGLSTTDGNVFGGGRNFFGDNDAAGRVEGNITVNMSAGTLQGSLFGGGRQALSGVNRNGEFPTSGWDVADHGNVTINVSGGTIGNASDQGIHLLCENDESIGDIFGSGKGDTKNYMNYRSGRVTNTTINITGSPRIHGAVFGGGEMASLGWWDEGTGEFYDNTGQATITIGRTGTSDNPVIGTWLELDPDYVNDAFQINGTGPVIPHSEWTILEEVNGVKRVVHTCTGNVFGGSQGDVDFEDWAIEPNNWPIMGRGRTAEVTINSGTIMSDVFGGSEQGVMAGNTKVTINGGTIGDTVIDANNQQYAFSGVYGAGYGSDDPADDNMMVTYFGQSYRTDSLAGRTFGSSQVDLLGGTLVGSVFGGSGYAYVSNTTTVNVGSAAQHDYTVGGNIYGGNNHAGSVVGNTNVLVKAGTLGNATGNQTDVFGGGYGEHSATSGHVNVVVDSIPNVAAPIIYGDVYGGSAFGSVNDNIGNDTTRVSILAGTIARGETRGTAYGGNVYGGGLGEANVMSGTTVITDNSHKGQVNGVIEVNVGEFWNTTSDLTGNDTTVYFGYATIGNNVYGCNNTNGSPQENVVVNIYGTHQDLGVNTVDDHGYAIDNVFGGGNFADYTAEHKTAYVNIFGCDNTIRRVFGGGDAAASPNVSTDIQGGRMDQVFGGGNGDRGPDYAANITEDVTLAIHGGQVNLFFVGSNQNGLISGNSSVTVDDNGPCSETMDIDEFFCGGNYVNVIGNVDAVIDCNNGMTVRNLYGGCNKADILDDPDTPEPEGNVNLVVKGGYFQNVYGGSKGDLAGLGEGHTNREVIIDGNVTLTICGGTIDTVFGGCNVNGHIKGNIVVNVYDSLSTTCPLVIHNVYGGGRSASYHPTTPGAYPEINIMKGTISKNEFDEGGNVFGGGYGGFDFGGNDVHEATVTSSPKITIGDSSLESTHANNETIIEGNVYGGGHRAGVTGNPHIILDGTHVVDIHGNVYGGGCEAQVTGDTQVEIKEPNQP